MVNTEDIYDEVLETFLGRRGFAFTLDLKLAMMGLTARDAFGVLSQRFGLEQELDVIQHEVERIFFELIPQKIRTMEGLFSLFEQIDQRSIPRVVVTSSPRKLANWAMKFAGIERNFQFVLTGDDIERGKPDPQIYQLAMQKLNVAPTQLMVFEDSYNGSLAAARAGAFTIAVPGRHSVNQDFSHADLVVSSLQDQRIFDLLVEFRQPYN